MKIIQIIFSCLILLSCTKDKVIVDENNSPNPIENIENTLGFGLLDKVKGIWNGAVTSTTPLGGYPEWIVDFRPISENQISSKNELDTINDIHMSFFVAKYNGEYKIAFRNGGSFAGQSRVSYLLADSVSETSTQSFYRFSEIVIGKNRAYTEVIFKEDSLIIKAFTNNYNTQSTSTPHMTWRARRQDLTSCQPATSNFSFPKKTLTKDFTNTFAGQIEAIYYSLTGGDPYPETDQPYLGKATINYSYASGYSPLSSDKVFLIITTQPLLVGGTLNPGNLIYRSRYVILAANDLNYTFNYMHPGTYYLYALYDGDGNNLPSSGDWFSISNTSFIVNSLATVTSATIINFTIP
jgi:hypothetical protein